MLKNPRFVAMLVFLAGLLVFISGIYSSTLSSYLMVGAGVLGILMSYFIYQKANKMDNE